MRATNEDMYRIQRAFKAVSESAETSVENYDNCQKALLAKAIEVAPPECKDILCEIMESGNPAAICHWKAMFIAIAKYGLEFDEALKMMNL